MPLEESEAVLSSRKSDVLGSARVCPCLFGECHLQAELDRSCWQELQSDTVMDPHTNPASVSLAELRVSRAHSRLYAPVWEPAESMVVVCMVQWVEVATGFPHDGHFRYHWTGEVLAAPRLKQMYSSSRLQYGIEGAGALKGVAREAFLALVDADHNNKLLQIKGH
jgi:hypothetical protein